MSNFNTVIFTIKKNGQQHYLMVKHIKTKNGYVYQPYYTAEPRTVFTEYDNQNDAIEALRKLYNDILKHKKLIPRIIHWLTGSWPK